MKINKFLSAFFVFSLVGVLFLGLARENKAFAQSRISVSYHVTTLDSINMSPLSRARILFFGRINPFQGWRYISSTSTNFQGEGVVQAARTIYNDFAITVLGPRGWISTGGHLRGTAPHSDCRRVSLSRWECNNIRSTYIRGESFMFIFKPSSTRRLFLDKLYPTPRL